MTGACWVKGSSLSAALVAWVEEPGEGEGRVHSVAAMVRHCPQVRVLISYYPIWT